MSAHQIEQILSKASAKYVDSAKADIMSALREFKDLLPELENFMYPDGKRRQAFRLKGTIPVPYKGVSYNIPVSVYLWDTHPYYAPICYVTPTSDMVIRESESVNNQGRVFLPYLKDWRFPGYDLNGLLQVMVVVFQEKCPVFAKPSGATSKPSVSSMPSPQPTPYPQTTPYPASSTAGMPPYPTGNTAPYPQSNPYPGYPSAYPGYGGGFAGYPNQGSTRTPPPVPPPPADRTTSIGGDHIKQSLISALQDKFRNKLRDKLGTSQAELASIRQTQNDLKTGQTKLKKISEDLESQQRQLEQFIFVYQDKKTELEKALAECGAGKEGPPIDEAIEAATPLHRQLVDNYAADLACDDTVYTLGKALQHHNITAMDYIKQVRNVYRRQFIYRATMQKCRRTAGLSV